jgi:hypothetical protein
MRSTSRKSADELPRGSAQGLTMERLRKRLLLPRMAGITAYQPGRPEKYFCFTTGVSPSSATPFILAESRHMRVVPWALTGKCSRRVATLRLAQYSLPSFQSSILLRISFLLTRTLALGSIIRLRRD